MKKIGLISLCILSHLLFAQSGFKEGLTTQSDVELSFSTVGTIGNAFRGYRSGAAKPASCVFPKGAGVEHIWEGGFWVGGIRAGQYLVSTSAVDGPFGYTTGRAGFEFTASINATIKELSNSDTSLFFDSTAIAIQQFEFITTDSNLFVPGSNIPVPSHNPLYVKVQLRILNFNMATNKSIVFFDLNLINIGNGQLTNAIDSLYFGLYTNAVVRDINLTPPGSGGASFYNRGGNGFIDSLNAAYTYDHSGDTATTNNSYVSQLFLGARDKSGFYHPKSDSSFKVNYNAWGFNDPGQGTFQSPSDDSLRYKKMSRGIQEEDCWTQNNNCGGGTYQEQLNKAGNRSDLISFGPFSDFALNDTINIAYAYVLADKVDDGAVFSENTAAQRADLVTNLNAALDFYYGEDVNYNGILDPGEDIDMDGSLSRYGQVITGLAEINQGPPLKFNNPVRSTLEIDLAHQQGQVSSIEILSLNGSLIRTIDVGNTRLVQEDLSDLTPNIYLIRVRYRGYQQKVEKLIKI